MEGHYLVHHFWQDHRPNERRRWIFSIKPNQIEEDVWKAFQEEMRGRSIRPSEGHDVLRWGYSDKGVFNIKEAYNIRIRNDVVVGELWKKI